MGSKRPSVRLRLNARIEMRESESVDPIPALLVSADAEGLTLRCSRTCQPGRVLHLTGEPSLNESYTFKALVTRCHTRNLPDEQLEYEEIHAEVREGEGAYHAFISSLTRSYQELREDLRFILPLPARLRYHKFWIQTQVENVSFGGLFATLPEGYSSLPGERIEFEVRFPDGQTQSGSGLVVFVVSPKVAKQLGGTPGIGLRLDFEQMSREKWGRAVEALRPIPARPETNL